MNLKTADLCDACNDAQACVLPFRSHGQRRAFAGRIRTVRAGRDVSRIRDLVAEPGHDQVLVVDGGGSLARAAGRCARGHGPAQWLGRLRDPRGHPRCGGVGRDGHRRQGAGHGAAAG